MFCSTRVVSEYYPFFFFFQAEDGIRAWSVTGVQTCALPIYAVPGTACFTAFATKICRSVVLSSETPSFSSHVTHGTGSLPAMVAPPAAEGFSAVRTVWMLRDGRWSGPRPWPDGSQRLAAMLKRLAEMFVGHPAAALGSYHATHGTVRPVPAKALAR